MRSGYLISFLVLIITAISVWGDYHLLQMNNNAQYSWAIWLNGIQLIPVIGLIMHKNWGRVILKIILWIWVIATFFIGIAIAAAEGAKGIPGGMMMTLKEHWMQFVLFGGLLFYLNTEKVKTDFSAK